MQRSAFDGTPPEASADFPWHLRRLGVTGAGRSAPGARLALPDLRGVRTERNHGSAWRASIAAGALQVACAEAPGAGRTRGRVSVDDLNAEFDSLYLEEARNPRWIAKPAVAYLWARTAECGNCRAEIPLLKTRWLCKRGPKRILLTMTSREDGSGVDFGVELDVPKNHDDGALGEGTMSRSGAKMSRLLRDRDHAGLARTRAHGKARRAHDCGCGGRTGGQGVSASERGGIRIGPGEPGGTRSTVCRDSFWSSRRTHAGKPASGHPERFR